MRKGFTLAEVLIALAVIGVLAALVIPSVINTFEEAAFKAQFKKTYSTVTNAYKQIALQEGSLCDLQIKIRNEDANSTVMANKWQALLEQYLSISKIVAWNPSNYFLLDGSSMPNFNSTRMYSIGDGSFIGHGTLSAGCNSYGFGMDWSKNNLGCNDGGGWDDGAPPNTVVPIVVDLNGYKKPNKLGKDIHLMYIDEWGRAKLHEDCDPALGATKAIDFLIK